MRAIHWFRNDLRVRDNTALREAARAAEALLCVFVLDPRVLAASRAAAPRLRFLADCLARLAAELEARGSRLVVWRGAPDDVLARLAHETHAGLVTWNRDGSPYSRARDRRVRTALERAGVRVLERKDRVVFEASEVCKADGTPYSVYTPFLRAWRERFEREPQAPAPSFRLPPPPPGVASGPLPDARALGAERDTTRIPVGGEDAALRRLRAFLDGPARDYARARDLPARDGTSRLSPYFRLGAISVRTALHEARALIETDRAAAAGVRKWTQELVWRDFYAAILASHPHVLARSFRPEFDALPWRDDEAGFQAWVCGRTGFPIVDAGMRQLAETGWMHNRVRMLVASFLVKDLLVDWRLGERFFFERLVDGDPASNNGGWQWSAGTGTDAQPFFRIFNPTTQGLRFDPDGEYVRRFVPELRGLPGADVHRPTAAVRPVAAYPPPILDHAERRVRALEAFAAVRRRGRE